MRFSPDMTTYVDVYSRTDLPETMELHDARDGRLIQTLEKGDITALTAAGFRPPERFTAKGATARPISTAWSSVRAITIRQALSGDREYLCRAA